jgi:hypothetical protein
MELRQSIGIGAGMTARQLAAALGALPEDLQDIPVTVLDNHGSPWVFGSPVAVWIGDENEPVVEFDQQF